MWAIKLSRQPEPSETLASNYGTTPWNKVGQSKGFSTSVGLALCFRGPWRPFHTPFVWHKCQVRVQWCVMPKPYRGHRKVQRVRHSKWKTSPETRSAKVTRSTRCVIRLLSVAGTSRGALRVMHVPASGYMPPASSQVRLTSWPGNAAKQYNDHVLELSISGVVRCRQCRQCRLVAPGHCNVWQSC